MFQPEIKMSDPMSVAFLLKRGSYAQIPEGYGQLYGWVAMNGLTPAHGGMPAAVYLTDPATVPEEEAAWELWAPLAGDPAPREADEAGLGVKFVDACWVASAMHRGPYDTVESTYSRLGSWIFAQGYTMAGPPMEIYLSDPDDTPPEEYLTEIRFPVAKA